jgi:hypothetical protein
MYSRTHHLKSESNVIGIHAKQNEKRLRPHRAVKMMLEWSGFNMVYSRPNEETLFGVPIIGWAQTTLGDIEGIVPWRNEVKLCGDIDFGRGRFEGYIQPNVGKLRLHAPEAVERYLMTFANPLTVVPNEIPDLTETYALFVDEQDEITLTPIDHWILIPNGVLSARTRTTAVPEGLITHEDRHFCYYVAKRIADKLRAGDARSLNAIARIAFADRNT